MTRRRTRHPRAGFTLIEMIVSMVIAVILMATMTSAIVLATHAIPSDDNDAAATVTTARVIQKLRHELQQAHHLTERTATAVTMVLPDQNGDAAPEVIRYAWAGSAGGPLTRQRNGHTPVIVIDRLDTFALTYDTATHTATLPGVVIESAEQLFSSYTGDGSTQYFNIKNNHWLGFRVSPTLPAGATSWHLTRVSMQGGNRGADSNGILRFELTAWESDQPANTILDFTDLLESDIGNSSSYHEVAYTNGGPFRPGEDAAITLKTAPGSSGDAGTFLYDNSAPATNIHTTYDAGSSWDVNASDTAVHHFAYGTYTAPDEDWAFARPRITEVSLSLSLSRSPGRTYDTTVVLPNAPDALTKLWEADFASDPLNLDLDADGSPDFAGTFNTGRVSDGVWALQAGLQLEPATYAFDQPTTLDLRLRDLTEDGAGGGLKWRCDRGGGQHATIVARINAVGGQQALMVKSTDATGTVTLWHLTTADANEWVRLRLTLDPANDRVAVRVNGDNQGAFPLYTTADTGQPSLDFFDEAANAGVQLDHLSLRVGGAVSVATVGTGP